MRVAVLILLFAVAVYSRFNAYGEAAPVQTGSVYQNTSLVRVVDGDTVRLTLGLGFGMFRVDQSYRLAHIDAPETNTEAGKRAKAALEGVLTGKRLIAEITGEDKYGRFLVSLTACDPSGVCVNANKWMLSNSHAKPYEGGAR